MSTLSTGTLSRRQRHRLCGTAIPELGYPWPQLDGLMREIKRHTADGYELPDRIWVAIDDISDAIRVGDTDLANAIAERAWCDVETMGTDDA
jgi:hypothetical protein